MKKLIFSILITLPLLLILPSCSNGSGGSDSGNGNDNEYLSPMSFTFLTANRCYIGGSLIWNPGTKAGQLSAGTKIGVRIGKLTKITESIPVMDGSQTEYVVNGSSFNSWSDLSRSPSTTKVRYEDEPSKAEYGYLIVNSISADSINLTYTKVDSNNRASSKSFSIGSVRKEYCF